VRVGSGEGVGRQTSQVPARMVRLQAECRVCLSLSLVCRNALKRKEGFLAGDDYSCVAARDSAKQNGQFVESGTLFGARPCGPRSRQTVWESKRAASIVDS